MEYPGYSIYLGKPTEELVKADALLLYKYLQTDLGVVPGKQNLRKILKKKEI
jgi:hypothetical protein